MLVWRRVAPQGNLKKRDYERLLHEWAWQLLEESFREEYGLIISEKDLQRNECGKPYLKNHSFLHFNISHCEGLIACIISEHEAGIDVEGIRPFGQRVMRKVCSLEEQLFLETLQNQYHRQGLLQKQIVNEYFFRLWTLKESYIKAVGKGLSLSMKESSFCWIKEKWQCKEQEEYSFHQLKLNSQFILSWCEKI